jgi:MerR family transcriptional regulator, light-induced transcriptional regulator
VPVSTLRVWERRYGAFRPAKSEGQHRLYAEADVIKATLLRQLTEAGHSIGTIAHLDADPLQGLLAQARAGRSQAPELAGVRVVVIGAGLAARLNASAWQATYLGKDLELRQVFADLDAVEEQPNPATPGSAGADLLLVRLHTLHAGAGAQLARVVAQLGVRQAIVLYQYGAFAAVEALRDAAMIVRREPVSDVELAELIRSQVVVDAAATMAALRAGALIPPRHFSEEMLSQVAASPTSLLCECPKHLVDLVRQLASFEDYSMQCLNRTTEDAQVHAYLRSVAGSARALFERALMVVAQEGEASAPKSAIGRA